ncbi:hypothetical protein [Terriglobus tenax]|uniref:hypothetical protein n=1 Tax=Terriglobus tenax TaxID=1111115 RepID=UPI0021E09BA0|nr:hypothetical protein [Terriglobus tenax]
MFRRISAGLLLLATSAAITAQEHDHASMPGMTMEPTTSLLDMEHSMQRMDHPTSFIDSILNHVTSGTTAEPVSTPMPMLMKHHGEWMLMLHGSAFVTDTQQSGPRGKDKFFSTNWVMPMAQRKAGPGLFTARAMFSLEPATITDRRYPELFQQGETAFGQPIVDGQHPHNFLMELAAIYDLRPSENTLVSFYAAPVGDPAIGPIAYPHRWSAAEDPIATLGHHQQDSTHIAYNVFTAGVTYRWIRVEQSGFHGGEPDEGRWQFQSSANGHGVDSYSTRVTVNPTRNWSGQYSIAHIKAPEASHQGEDQARQTASVMYNLPIGKQGSMNMAPGNLAISLIWGRTRAIPDNKKQNSYTLEALYHFAKANSVWTRMELAGRTTELLGDSHEEPAGHVAAYTFGYDRDWHIAPHLTAAPGAQFTTYSPSPALTAAYGAHPFAVQAFVRFRITSK